MQHTFEGLKKICRADTVSTFLGAILSLECLSSQVNDAFCCGGPGGALILLDTGVLVIKYQKH